MSNKHTEKVVIEIGVSDIAKRVLSVIREQQQRQQPEKTIKDEFLTANQTADFLNVTLNTLYRWEKRGYLVPTRIGARRLYRIEDLNKILQSKNETQK